jgi:hypothetical protein
MAVQGSRAGVCSAVWTKAVEIDKKGLVLVNVATRKARRVARKSTAGHCHGRCVVAEDPAAFHLQKEK